MASTLELYCHVIPDMEDELADATFRSSQTEIHLGQLR